MFGLPNETRAYGVEIAQRISGTSVTYDLKERLMPKRANGGIPQVEGRCNGVLSKADHCGMDVQEGQQSQLHHGIIGLPSQQPERGAQCAFQLANAEVEGLSEPER
jgi:hypothetical protein